MGMDVYGKAPSNETGRYFRNNIWWWHPLAEYCQSIAPEIALKCDTWHTNDGGGLEADDAVALAERLEAEVANGNCDKYMRARQKYLDELPDTECTFCHGKPRDEAKSGETDGEKASDQPKCGWCDGTGRQKDPQAYYFFDIDNVKRFAEFLRHSGGFEIH